MKVRNIIAPYAKALFHLAKSKEELQRQEESLEALLTDVLCLPKWDYFFSSPQITKEKKEDFLRRLLKDKVDDKIFNFFIFLIKRDRFRYLSEMIKDYQELVIDYLGELQVTLISAIPLDEQEKKTCREQLKKKYRKEIKLKEEIRPSMLAGAILMIGNRMLDWSIQGKMNRLNEKLLTIKI